MKLKGLLSTSFREDFIWLEGLVFSGYDVVEGAVSAWKKKDPLVSSTSYPNTANLSKDLCRANFVLLDLWLVERRRFLHPCGGVSQTAVAR